MKILIAAAGLILIAGAAEAKLPTVNATCPTGIEFHSDEGGPAYINGKEAKLKKNSDSSFTAKKNHIVIDVTVNADGSVAVSYTGKDGANGICQVGGDGNMKADKGNKKKHKKDECPPDVSEADRANYPACN